MTQSSKKLNSLVVYFDPASGGYKLAVNEMLSPLTVTVDMKTTGPGELTIKLKSIGEVQCVTNHSVKI